MFYYSGVGKEVAIIIKPTVQFHFLVLDTKRYVENACSFL